MYVLMRIHLSHWLYIMSTYLYQLFHIKYEYWNVKLKIKVANTNLGLSLICWFGSKNSNLPNKLAGITIVFE